MTPGSPTHCYFVSHYRETCSSKRISALFTVAMISINRWMDNEKSDTSYTEEYCSPEKKTQINACAACTFTIRIATSLCNGETWKKHPHNSNCFLLCPFWSTQVRMDSRQVAWQQTSLNIQRTTMARTYCYMLWNPQVRHFKLCSLQWHLVWWLWMTKVHFSKSYFP